MYGQYGCHGPFSGSDGNSSYSESSFPGASSKKRKRRVPLLGKRQRIVKPVPILPALRILKESAKDERIANTHADDSSDISVISLPSDLSCDGGGGTTPGMNNFLHHSDKGTGENLEGKFNSSTDSQRCMELTNNLSSMQELEVYNQLPHSDHHQGWPENCEKLIPECQAIGHISEAHKTNGHVNNPGKDVFIFEEISSIHRECPYSSSHSHNLLEEKIVTNLDAGSNPNTCLSQNSKTLTPVHGEVYRSSALCEKAGDEKYRMGPPLMCSAARANKAVFRDIINSQDLSKSKKNAVDLREIPILLQASEENHKQMDVNYINKENDTELFASKTPAVSRTPAKHNPSGNKIPLLDTRSVHLTKERDFQVSKWKDTATEKQLDKNLGSCAPSCNVHMKESTPPLDFIKHVKSSTQENGNICKLDSVKLNINKENDFHLPTKKYRINEKPRHKPLVDEYASLCKPIMKETTPLFGDVISLKQEYQTVVAESQPAPSYKSKSKTVQEYSAESKKEFQRVSTQGTGAVEGSVAVQECQTKGQAVQPKPAVKLVHIQVQNTALKPAERLNNYITVNGKGYRVLELLGQGGSSKVFKVQDPNSTQELAMKCVDLSSAEPSVAQGYLNEIELLRRLQGSDTVIGMTDFEYAEDRQMLYVVMERGETDFSKLMKNISKTNCIPIITIIYYWVEILRAVKNIHKNGVIHSDLKPSNFLLVGGRLKLIDFGIASSVQSDMTSVFKDVPTGTFNYMSPEAIQTTHNTNGNKSGFKISYKSDIWSLGCILYNLLYGKTPFQHIAQPWAKIAAITNPHHTIDYPKTRNDCPPVILEAVQLCLTFDPKKRPTAAELLELPYINYNPVRRFSPETEHNN